MSDRMSGTEEFEGAMVLPSKEIMVPKWKNVFNAVVCSASLTPLAIVGLNIMGHFLWTSADPNNKTLVMPSFYNYWNWFTYLFPLLLIFMMLFEICEDDTDAASALLSKLWKWFSCSVRLVCVICCLYAIFKNLIYNSI
ncbi:uncharacterized protein LOC114915120 [Cajanus cajan]|uniref:uncharacterized protein LOC114915120 n=1 Tax=Cajanus cajan TaxID=3821 RepID=UPI0010FBB779|nr:uncharacterized protein LOC114915120 [Cajanus cajan]